MTSAGPRPQIALRELILVLGVGGLITAIRIATLFATPLNLGPDEAQYWDWSRTLAFGYFSKPPMIAWLIATSTAVCGDGEFCIRIWAPVLYFATSLLVFASANVLYGGRCAALAAIVLLTLPGISLSSVIASTDVPLLFAWSLALYFFLRSLRSGAPGWAAGLGAALGVGLLSKYAMVYFPLCAAIYLAVSRDRPNPLPWRHLMVSAVIAVLALAPNLLWNMRNGFATVTHTAANASWGGTWIHPMHAIEFVGDQAGVFGPILLGAFVWYAAISLRPRAWVSLDDRSRLLLSFSLPILLIILAQGVVSRANANWAAAAYPAATILVTAWLDRAGRRWALAGSYGLHFALMLGFSVLCISPSLIDRLGADNAFKRVRGWDLMADGIFAAAERMPGSTIMMDDRMILTSYLYYGRGHPMPVTIWDDDGIPENHYELTRAFAQTGTGPVLLVARDPAPTAILNHFARAEPLGPLSVPVGGGRVRTVHLFRLSGFTGR